MRRHAPVLILAAALVAIPAASQAFFSRNHMTVHRTGPQSFVVDHSGTGGAPAYWCAASDFVQRGLGAASTTRIYRTSPAPRKQGQGIAFSLSDKAAVPSGITTFGAKDLGMNAAQAEGLCDDMWRIWPYD